MEHYLLIDLGTGSTRAALADSAGRILGIRSFQNAYRRDPAYADAQYFLPREWETQLLRCLAELREAHPGIRVDAVSAAGARQSIVLVDERGEAFYGLPNIDNRGAAYMDRIAGRDEIYRASGRWVTEDFCAAKLMGLREVHPEIYRRTRQVLSLSEWIAHIFTGVCAMEPSQACETQLYDIGTGRWSEELCAAYGLDMDILPRLLPSGSALGPVRGGPAELCGLAEGAPFIIGGADTQVALRQLDMSPGDLAIVSGTTSPVTALSRERFFDPGQRVWTNAGLGGKGFVVEMNPGVTGLNYQRAKDGLCPDLSYEQLEALYAGKTAFECTASFSSLLFYERRPLRRGGFFARSPMADGLDRVDMVWAVLADVACSIYEQLRRLSGLLGTQRDFVWGCGGGFRSPALCRMLADLSGMSLRLKPGFEQATLLGLVRICCEGLGVPYSPVQADAAVDCAPEGHGLIHEYYPLWLENRSRANEK